MAVFPDDRKLATNKFSMQPLSISCPSAILLFNELTYFLPQIFRLGTEEVAEPDFETFFTDKCTVG